MQSVAVLEAPVLVLNRSWIAVHVATARRAMGLLCQGLARAVTTEDYATYDFESWCRVNGSANGHRYIRTPRLCIRAPEVIVLVGYNGRASREIRFSRRNIFERDRNTCQYCGRRAPREDLTLDHVIPRCRGGASTWDNVVVACLACNDRKGGRLPGEVGMRLRRAPARPRGASRLGLEIARVRQPNWRRFLESAYWEAASAGGR